MYNFVLSLIIILSFCSNSLAQLYYKNIEPEFAFEASFPYGDDSYNLDLDSNGTVDFTFRKTISYMSQKLYLKASSGNFFISENSHVKAFSYKDTIKSNDNWTNTEKLIWELDYPDEITNFNDSNNKFIVLKFNSQAITYYAWIRMRNPQKMNDYAFSSTTNMIVGLGIPPIVEKISTQDVNDNNNASDIKIKFDNIINENLLERYRALIVPFHNNTYSVDSAKLVTSGNYFDIAPKGNSIDTLFPNTTKDVYGNTIKPNINYEIYILSIPKTSLINDTMLSNASAKFFISTPTGNCINLLAISKKIPSQDYKIDLTFKAPINQQGITKFKIIFAETQHINNLNADSVAIVSNPNAYIISPNNDSIYTISFGSNSLKTYNGKPLEKLKYYKFKVLSVCDSLNANKSTLSVSSNSFVVYSPTVACFKIKIIDNDNSNTFSDALIHFNASNNDTLSASYRIYIIPNDSTKSISKNAILNSEFYNAINHSPTSNLYQLQLKPNTKDTYGYSLDSSKEYAVTIYSIADSIFSDVSSMSAFSKPFILNSPNSFFAGDTGIYTSYYYNIIDTGYVAIPYNTPQPVIEFDLDSNGVSDFKIIASASGSATGSSWSSCSIEFFNHCQSAFSKDSIESILQMDSLDMIYPTLNWKTKSTVLAFENSYTIPFYESNSGGVWLNKKGYLPIRIIDIETTYYWINMNVFSSGFYVYSFAKQKNSTSISTNYSVNSPYKIYPNPARDYITIEGNETKISNLALYDCLGKLVYFENFLVKTSIRTNALNNGFYTLVISTSELKYSSKILISN